MAGRAAHLSNCFMPRFFADLHDGTEIAHNEDGYELPDLDAARAQAVSSSTLTITQVGSRPYTA